MTLLVSCLTQTKHRKEQGLHIKNAQLSLSCVILRPRSNAKLDHNKKQKTSKKPSPASGTAVLRSFVSKASWGGLFDGLFVFLFSSSNKLQINAMHIPLNSLVRILRIKHIAHLQSNRRLKSFQVSSICIFQHLRLWDLFNLRHIFLPTKHTKWTL